MLRKMHILINKIKGNFKLLINKTIYLSFGENCLTDNILQRHSMKTITTPFSHGRSNVEYILQLEKDQYKDFVNLEYLKYENLNGKNVPRLKKYNSKDNAYDILHENGFEFTHHDVIKHSLQREKMMRRVTNMRKLIGKKKLIILYHHRLNENTNQELLFKDLGCLAKIYSTDKFRAEVVCFTQVIIQEKNERKMEYIFVDKVHFFKFYTIAEWAGNDDNLLWAKNDEDLITKMITQIKNI